jgi:hypothetical protein
MPGAGAPPRQLRGHPGWDTNAVGVELADKDVGVVAGHQAATSADGQRQAWDGPRLAVHPHVHLGAPDGNERHAGQPQEREERRGVEGATDGGEHGEPVAGTGEVLVDAQVEPAAVRGGESQVELEAVVSDLEARHLELGAVDAGQAPPEAVVARRIYVAPCRDVQLDVVVVAVDQQNEFVSVGVVEELGFEGAVGGIISDVDDEQPPDRRQLEGDRHQQSAGIGRLLGPV